MKKCIILILIPMIITSCVINDSGKEIEYAEDNIGITTRETSDIASRSIDSVHTLKFNSCDTIIKIIHTELITNDYNKVLVTYQNKSRDTIYNVNFMCLWNDADDYKHNNLGVNEDLSIAIVKPEEIRTEIITLNESYLFREVDSLKVFPLFIGPKGRSIINCLSNSN